jgi:CTD small phosphatase-like protein 2
MTNLSPEMFSSSLSSSLIGIVKKNIIPKNQVKLLSFTPITSSSEKILKENKNIKLPNFNQENKHKKDSFNSITINDEDEFDDDDNFCFQLNKNDNKNHNNKNAKDILSKFEDNFDEIIHSLSNGKIDKNNNNNNNKYKDITKIKKNNTFKENDRISIDLKNFLNENQLEIKYLSNTEEISDFNEYNQACISMLDNIIPVTQNKLPKIKFPFAHNIPKKKRLAIFDLDETLAHSEYKNIKNSQHILTIKLPSEKSVKIGLNIRPHLIEALKEISKNYYIVIYTASDHHYADTVLDFIDKKKEFFKYRLYRRNCKYMKDKFDDKIKFYCKDLEIFEGIDLKDMVIIDNSILSYALQLNNGIPIMPYKDSKKDFELMFLAGYLNSICEFEDLREANKKFIKLEELVNDYKKNELSLVDDEEIENNGQNSPLKIAKTDESVINYFLKEAKKVNEYISIF